MSNKITKKKRICSKEKEFAPLDNKSKQICLPIEADEYARIIFDAEAYRSKVDDLINKNPELFPSTIKQGYKFHDILPMSKKMPDIRLRRIKVAVPDGSPKEEVFTIRPSFVMPYMTGYTNDVEKGLFLRQWAVPYWALAYVFGKDENYWYRLENRIGRNSIVGTTIKESEKIPKHVLADEKHTRFNGNKAYIALTAGQDCILGASITLEADETNLTQAYEHFKTEAQNIDPDYSPETVNTDGWSSTQLAWLNLFPLITIILCFLHAFINIRSRCKTSKEHFHTITAKVWDTYHSPNPKLFLENVIKLQIWAKDTLPDGSALQAILKLCSKSPYFLLAYFHPSAYRTSNMIDRHMEPLNRYLFSCKYYHGHLLSAEYAIRAWALLHNFWPYCPRSNVARFYQSPVHKFNDRIYHHNWLHNLLISASMGGFRL